MGLIVSIVIVWVAEALNNRIRASLRCRVPGFSPDRESSKRTWRRVPSSSVQSGAAVVGTIVFLPRMVRLLGAELTAALETCPRQC